MIQAKTIRNLLCNADYPNYMPDVATMRLQLNIDEAEMINEIAENNQPYLLTLEK